MNIPNVYMDTHRVGNQLYALSFPPDEEQIHDNHLYLKEIVLSFATLYSDVLLPDFSAVF